jgi:predicted nucleotidyltransferase
LERIAARWQPLQVWLFGSRARGQAGPSSDDVDPLVSWRLQKGSGVRADIVPCRASDFREDQDTPNTLAYEAVRNGILVHER